MAGKICSRCKNHYVEPCIVLDHATFNEVIQGLEGEYCIRCVHELAHEQGIQLIWFTRKAHEQEIAKGTGYRIGKV